jgi:cell division protein DivIC
VIRGVRNKYVLTIIVFVTWISFFDHNDLFTQLDRKKELTKLEASKAYYEEQIASTQKELQELENDQAVLEKFARENFYLKKPGEQVFIVVDSTAEKSEDIKQ